jgi:polyhydroxyalkanoate synthesis regulator phasin
MNRLIGRLEEAGEAGVTVRVIKDVIGKGKNLYTDRGIYKKFLSNYPADLQKRLLDVFDKRDEVIFKKKEAEEELARLDKQEQQLAKLDKQLKREQDALDEEGSKYGRWFMAKNGKDVEWKTNDEIEQARNSR